MELTKILTDEHRAIEVVLKCLGKIDEEAQSTGKLDAEPANQVIDIVRNFVDKCHHSKEENHLFKKLVEKGIPQEGGPVGQMLLEHDEGREFVGGMADNISRAADGNSEALKLYSENAQGFIKLLNAHIQKEDIVLFPMADDILSEEEQGQLMKAFESVETDEMGEGTHEKYLKMIKTMAKRYDVDAKHIKVCSCGCGH